MVNVSNIEQGIVIRFGDSSSVVSTVKTLDVVIDLSGFGDIIGVEIVGLRHNCGNSVLDGIEIGETIGTPRMAITYDESCDAFYLRIKDERSLDQLEVSATISLDNKGAMNRLDVKKIS